MYFHLNSLSKSNILLWCAIIFIFLIKTPVSGQNVGVGTTDPDEKLTVAGTIKSSIVSSSESPQFQIHQESLGYGRINFSNLSSSQYFTLAGNPQRDSTMARFHIYNSDFGNIGTFTGHGRFGINASNPVAALHVDAQDDADLMRLQRDNVTKFRIFNNDAMVFGANWANPIADVIRFETPNMFIGFDGDHVPTKRLEVDGTVSSIYNSEIKFPQLLLFEDEYDYARMTFANESTSTFFNLEARPAANPSDSRFNLYNSQFGNILTATGEGRLGVNTVPLAAFHSNSVQGTDAIRIQSNGSTKFRILANNAISIGSNWDEGIANVVRVETPNMFIGFNGSHVPEEKLEVDGAIKIGSASATPSEGTIQYNPNSQEFQVYAENEWNTIAYKKEKIEIGDNRYGGKVFWLDESGEHGLVVSLVDLGKHEWGTSDCCYFDADGTGIYAGKRNTQLIIDNTQGSSLVSAAKACQNYSGGGYGDWYLPSTTEFSRILVNLVNSGLYSLTSNTRYWTSNEEIQIVDVRSFAYWNAGGLVLDIKSTKNQVRAIRAF